MTPQAASARGQSPLAGREDMEMNIGVVCGRCSAVKSIMRSDSGRIFEGIRGICKAILLRRAGIRHHTKRRKGGMGGLNDITIHPHTLHLVRVHNNPSPMRA